jgi:hypothetical protein
MFGDMMQLSKAAGDTGSGPTFGVDYIVNTYVRNQLAYRKQLIQDLQTVAYTAEELRAPILHITGEVFRRGIQFEPLVEDPDESQLDRLKEFMDDCNVFDQGLEEVLRQFHWDLNTVDDAFLYFSKEYYDTGDGGLRSRVTEIRRINPALIEYDLDETGLPKNSHFFCPLHREQIKESPEECPEEDCKQKLQPAMYRYLYRTEVHYFLDTEVVHLSKFNPTETYGWSPILTIFEKALTLIGMDRNLYRYFFERKMPASMVMVTTDDPESLKREREALAAKTRQDPNYIPVMGRVVERDQRQIMEKVFPAILDNFGVTDWKIVLPNPEEKAEATRIAQSQQRAAIAAQMLGMGFDVNLAGNNLKVDQLDFIVSGQPVPTAKLQGEQQALALEQAEMQAAQAEAQMEMQAQQAEQQAAQGDVPEEGEGEGDVPVDEEGTVPEEESEEGSAEVPVENSLEKGAENANMPYPRFANIESKNIKNPDLRKGVATSTWIDSLSDQGYQFPIIKQVSPDGNQVWFSNNGEEYVGNLSGTGVDKIEKAYFGNPVFSEAGGKKYFSDAYTAETGDGTSKPKAVNVERYDDDEDDD